MHVSMMFQGPVPPILCVSGGSLGFLTPFRPEEMVDAVKVALGLAKGRENGFNGSQDDIDVYPPNMLSYPYEPILKETDDDTFETGPVNGGSKFAFGRGDRICLSIRMRLECQVINREGAVRARYNVLNEVVIDRGSSPYLAALECFCDDVHLTTVQADGVIFATPTGSTAYSLAAGAAVVHPAVPCILVTPICPHVLSFRPMVFPDHVVLRCYVPDDARAEASVAFDGKHRQELHRGDSVQIRMSPYPVPTINRQDHSSDWLGSLKRNFNFNTRARQQPL
jgi:NAD+ kinase